jgi:hypothetical protein
MRSKTSYTDGQVEALEKGIARLGHHPERYTDSIWRLISQKQVLYGEEARISR